MDGLTFIRRDRALIKLDDEQKATASGILLAEKSVDKPQTGTLVATGPGFDEVGAVEGDHVVIGRYAGEEFKVGTMEEPLLVVHKDDVLAKLC